MIREIRIERLAGRRVLLTRDESGWTLHSAGLRIEGRSVGACFAEALRYADTQHASAVMKSIHEEAKQ